MTLTEYVLCPREERTGHINLATPCECRKISGRQNNKKLLAKLCEMHGVVDDVENKRTANINTCHLCPNKHCHNPNHSYIGTAKENQNDKTFEQRSAASKKAQAARMPEERRAAAIKASNTLPPEQRSAQAKRRMAARTPEERQAMSKRGGETRRKQTSKAIEVTHIESGDTTMYKSIREARRSLGLHLHLSEVCHGHLQQTGGYRARFV